MRVLAHDRVLFTDLVRRNGKFLEYAGMDVPNHDYWGQLAKVLRRRGIHAVTGLTDTVYWMEHEHDTKYPMERDGI